MKLTIKTLKQVEYKLDVESQKITVKQLKDEIQRVHSFDAEAMKLLFNGTILENDKTLEEYKIDNDFVLIMMNPKVKITEKSSDSQSSPPSQTQPAQTQPNQTQSQTQSQTSPKNSPSYETEISSLVEMGFERKNAENAIKAAQGNIDLAVEFLYNGIPERLPAGNSNANFGNNNISNVNVSPVQKVASIVKVICSRDPSALQVILQNIQQNDPNLFQQIKDNEAEFKELLTKPLDDNDMQCFLQYNREIEGGESGGASSGNRIRLSKEDEEAIKRLMELGNFDKADVLQTYFACEKNEEMAANMLFEQKMSEENFGGNILGSNTGNNNSGNNNGGSSGSGNNNNEKGNENEKKE